MEALATALSASGSGLRMLQVDLAFNSSTCTKSVPVVIRYGLFWRTPKHGAVSGEWLGCAWLTRLAPTSEIEPGCQLSFMATKHEAGKI